MRRQSASSLLQKRNGSFRARRRSAIMKHNYSSDPSASANQKPKKDRQMSFISRIDCSKDIRDEYEKKMKQYEYLVDALRSNDTFYSTLLALICQEFSSESVLHDAISLGAPEEILMLLVKRFPTLVAQVDRIGRNPLHIACALGASKEFVSYCISIRPSCAAATDNEGRTPIHHLCQGTWQGLWDVKSNASSLKNKKDLLWILYRAAPLSVMVEDNHGVGTLECALENDQSMDFIAALQNMIGHFHESEARRLARPLCDTDWHALLREDAPSSDCEEKDA